MLDEKIGVRPDPLNPELTIRDKRTWKRAAVERLLRNAALAVQDSDATRAAEAIRRAVDGDTVHYGKIDVHDWEVDPDADVADPVPPPLETNRLS